MSLVGLGGARTSQMAARNSRDGLGKIERPAETRRSSSEWLGLGEGHPLHLVDRIVDEILREPQGRSPWRDCSPDEPPPDRERLLRSLLLQILYSIACDRRLLEQLRYDLRFRWFAGLRGGDLVWSQADHALARSAILRSGADERQLRQLLRSLRPIALAWPEHFSFDETLIDRWQADLRNPAPAAETSGPSQQELLKAVGLSCSRDQVDPRLLRAIEWILTRICEPNLNCDSLAAEISMSRRALYYLFDAHGMTPAVVIRDIRLEHCKRLLADARHSRRKITAIALDLGFVNVYAFSRSFKQRYGIGPREYRRSSFESDRAATR